MAPRKRFKFGTFNVKNLALPTVSVYGKHYTPKEYAAKVVWTGGMLRQLDADFIGFQEVWSEQALRDGLDAAKFSTRDKYRYILFGGPEGSTTPRVAAATRLALVGEPEVITNFPRPLVLEDSDSGLQLSITRFERPVLKVTVQMGSTPITAFIAHLKSKRPKFVQQPGGQNIPEDDLVTADLAARALGSLRSLVVRASEAVALRTLVIQTTQGNKNPVIVMGDLNDGVQAVTNDIVEGEEPFRFNMFLQRPGHNRRYTVEEDKLIKARMWDVKLYDTETIQSRRSLINPIYTHIYNGRYESLDHILVSEEFFYRNPAKVGDVEYLQCFNDHLIDESLGGEQPPDEVSDHAALVVTLKLD